MTHQDLSLTMSKDSLLTSISKALALINHQDLAQMMSREAFSSDQNLMTKALDPVLMTHRDLSPTMSKDSHLTSISKAPGLALINHQDLTQMTSRGAANSDQNLMTKALGPVLMNRQDHALMTSRDFHLTLIS